MLFQRLHQDVARLDAGDRVGFCKSVQIVRMQHFDVLDSVSYVLRSDRFPCAFECVECHSYRAVAACVQSERDVVLITLPALCIDPVFVYERLRTESRTIRVRVYHVAGVAQRSPVHEALEAQEAESVGLILFLESESLVEIYFHMRCKEHSHFELAFFFESSACFVLHDLEHVDCAYRSNALCVRHIDETFDQFFFFFR